MSFKPEFVSRESRSLTEQVAAIHQITLGIMYIAYSVVDDQRQSVRSRMLNRLIPKRLEWHPTFDRKTHRHKSRQNVNSGTEYCRPVFRASPPRWVVPPYAAPACWLSEQQTVRNVCHSPSTYSKLIRRQYERLMSSAYKSRTVHFRTVLQFCGQFGQVNPPADRTNIRYTVRPATLCTDVFPYIADRASMIWVDKAIPSHPF